MKKFSTIGPDGNLYEFVFVDGRLMRVVISNPNTLVVVYGEYVDSKRSDSYVTVDHFARCLKVLCADENFNEYGPFLEELKHPSNHPEFFRIANEIMLESIPEY